MMTNVYITLQIRGLADKFLKWANLSDKKKLRSGCPVGLQKYVQVLAMQTMTNFYPLADITRLQTSKHKAYTLHICDSQKQGFLGQNCYIAWSRTTDSEKFPY